MTSLVGRGLVMLALLFATVGCVAGFQAGSRKSKRAWEVARNSALGFGVSMIIANMLMVGALLSHDFSVGYVAEVGSLRTPVHITIISLWASLNGSILFWGGILGVYVLAMVTSIGNKHREYMPYTLHVLLGVSVFFALLVASVADPFHPTPEPIPLDGPGPNPLLQNHWLMAVHPPMLYLGYVGMAVPFSMICAALLTGRLEAGWLVPLRRWMLIPWTFLTMGIVLGGWWSYGVLGWGGYWAWDPVENASFHPWLTATAFLHSAMVLQRKNLLRDWTLTLGMATFLLTLVGTFMTRSGVFNSVHSFTQSDIGPVFLVFIGVTFAYSTALLATRSHLLDESNEKANEELGPISFLVGTKLNPLSREFAVLLQNGLFATFTFMVFLGTLYPLLAESLQDRKISVGEPYFDRWALPLGVALVFLMGVGPALPWGRLPDSKLVRRFGPPVAMGFVLAAIGGATGIDKPNTILALWVCGFALQANLAEFVEPAMARARAKKEPLPTAAWRVFLRTRRRYGGHIAHFGVIMATIAIALSKGYKLEQTVTLDKGASTTIGKYVVTYQGARLEKQPHRDSVVATFDVTRNGNPLSVQEPRLNYYPTQREAIGTPAVHSTATEDLYLSLTQLPEDGKYVVVRAIEMPGVVWLWVAAVVMCGGSLLAAWPARRRKQVAAAPAAKVAAK